MELLRAVLQRVQPLSEPAFRRVSASFRARAVAAGEHLVSAGAPCRGLGLVERGVFISQSVVTSRAASCDLFAEGDFATDYVSVLTGGAATVDITALEPARVLWLPTEQLEPLFGASGELERLGRKLAERQFLQAVSRAGSLLSEAPAVRYRRLVEERPGLVERVPLYLVAQWLGVTPESLSRIRRRLVAQRRTMAMVESAAKSKAASAKAGGPKRPRAPREKP